MYTPGMSVMSLLLKNRYESKRIEISFMEKEKCFYLFSLKNFCHFGCLRTEGDLLEEEAKCHVRVSKQSCKQENRLILWGVRSTTKKKFSIFFYFFSPKKLEKYALTRPKMSKNSLTS
jgi:hypothetical protein